MQNELDTLLGNQFLIIGFIKEKLDIVNFVNNGYLNNDQKISRNGFLLFTAHIYYRSIVIDLCALYGHGNNESNNLYQLYSNKTILAHLKPDVLSKIKSMIKTHAKEIDRIKTLRNQQYAHYDFQYPAKLTFNLDELPTLNSMFDTAKQILLLCGQEKIDPAASSEYLLEMDNYLGSLTRLLK